MNKFRHTLLLLCTSLVACSDDQTSLSYFPLNEGLSWNYKVTSTTPREQKEHILQIKNIGIQEIGDESFYVRKTSSGNFYYIQETENGIVRKAKRTILEKYPSISNVQDNQRFVMKNPLRPGTEWKYAVKPYLIERAFESNTILKDTISYVMNWRIISTGETVETEFGKFENCLHIQGKADAKIRRALSIATDEVTFTTDEWYAKGVGLVKLIHQEDVDSNHTYGGSTVLDLQTFEN